MRAAIYLRISKDHTGEALGVTRQLEDCRETVAANGWEVAEVYTDNDISATSGKARPGYRKMLADVQAGTIDAIVAWAPDRIYRRMADLESFISVIEAHGTAIRTVKAGDLDLSTAYGRMIARILGAIATGEGEVKAERWKRSWRQRREAGTPTKAASRMFGYTVDSEVIPEEAEIAREAARRVLAGDSYLGICRWITEQGHTATRGRPWRPPTLKQYLTNPRLAGWSTLNGEIVGEGQWEAILDRETFEAVRALMKSRTSPAAPRVAVLNGLVFCGTCKTRMITSRASGKRTYRCPKRPDMPGCGGVSIDAERTEEVVEALTQAHLDRPTTRSRIESLRSEPSLPAELSDLQMRVAELEQQLDSPGVPVATILRAIDRAKDRQEELLSKIAATPSVPLPVQGGPWPTDLKRRRALVDLAVQRVEVDASPVRGGHTWRPERVRVTPR